MRLGILSSGGDCPGINSTIRGVGKSAITYHGFEVAGIFNGYNGILEKNFKMMTSHLSQVSCILVALYLALRETSK